MQSRALQTFGFSYNGIQNAMPSFPALKQKFSTEISSNNEILPMYMFNDCLRFHLALNAGILMNTFIDTKLFLGIYHQCNFQRQERIVTTKFLSCFEQAAICCLCFILKRGGVYTRQIC